MVEVGLEAARALDRGVRQAGAVPAEGLEERARVAAVLRARALVAGIEGAEAAVGPELRAVPQIHQAEYALADPAFAGLEVALQEAQFLEPLEYPEGEVDLDAGGIENLSVEIVRQNFAYRQLVDFGAPARSRWVGRDAAPLREHRTLKMDAGCLVCQAGFERQEGRGVE